MPRFSRMQFASEGHEGVARPSYVSLIHKTQH